MIVRNDKLSIAKQTKLLGFSRGMVYYKPKPLSESELALMHAIDKLHMDYPFMGSRMMRNQLNRNGFKVGRTHVRTLMRRMGIQAIYRKPKNTSANNPEHKIYPYLLSNMEIGVNQVWSLDTSYIRLCVSYRSH
jgi:putative transposase